MRIRGVVAIALVLLPAGLTAQRARIPVRRAPIGPTALPPQPPGIAREMAYRRSRVSFESYPFVSQLGSTPISGGFATPNRTSFGMGTRAELRANRFTSFTFDATSLFGKAAYGQTMELGTRLRPLGADHRITPFLDLRGGAVNSYDPYLGTFDPSTGTPGLAYGGRYSRGAAAIAGTGLDLSITRRFSLTTGASVMRSRMHMYYIYGTAPNNGPYTLTAYRFTAGLRFNPVHVIRTPTSEGQ